MSIYTYDMVLEFVVHGTAVPQGSIRHLGKGRPSVHANADKLKPWRQQVQDAAEAAIAGHEFYHSGNFPLLGPVALKLEVTRKKPVSAPKTKVTYPITKPDGSHLLRAVEDALTAAGVWADDAQAIDTGCLKFYVGSERRALPIPGVRVKVYRIDTVDMDKEWSQWK